MLKKLIFILIIFFLNSCKDKHKSTCEDIKIIEIIKDDNAVFNS
jgi:hypothetical protein